MNIKHKRTHIFTGYHLIFDHNHENTIPEIINGIKKVTIRPSKSALFRKVVRLLDKER